MSSDLAIVAEGLGKCYSLYQQAGDRLKQLLWGSWLRAGRPYYRDFWSLQGVDFTVTRGEVIGIVGRNGAGKSTLLQLVCGTLTPSTGRLQVKGRVAALLELGAGFNPDFTGLENVYMNATILGLSKVQVDERLNEILAFADIGDFIGQPVRTYSSGMFMRLAFAVATSVEPDILVIDEALSVGDGAFARKSFDRIMRLKDEGKTILFCSHSMYQVEALCAKAMWIEGGRLRMFGTAAEVTSAYTASLNENLAPSGLVDQTKGTAGPASPEPAVVAPPPAGSGRILSVMAQADGVRGSELAVRSGESNLMVTVEFSIDPALPPPGVALGFSDSNGLTVASCSSVNDGAVLSVSSTGYGTATVVFQRLPLLKGRYWLTSFLISEDGIHVYEQVERSVLLNVSQKGLEQGLVTMPHTWQR